MAGDAAPTFPAVFAFGQPGTGAPIQFTFAPPGFPLPPPTSLPPAAGLPPVPVQFAFPVPTTGPTTAIPPLPTNAGQSQGGPRSPESGKHVLHVVMRELSTVGDLVDVFRWAVKQPGFKLFAFLSQLRKINIEWANDDSFKKAKYDILHHGLRVEFVDKGNNPTQSPAGRRAQNPPSATVIVTHSRANNSEQLLASLGTMYGKVISVRTLTKARYRVTFEAIDSAISFVMALNNLTNMQADFDVSEGMKMQPLAFLPPLVAPAHASAAQYPPFPPAPLPLVTPTPLPNVTSPFPPVQSAPAEPAVKKSAKDELAELLARAPKGVLAKIAHEFQPAIASAAPVLAAKTSAPQSPAKPLPSPSLTLPMSPVPTKIFVNPAKFNPHQSWEEGEVSEDYDGTIPHAPPPPMEAIQKIGSLIASMQQMPSVDTAAVGAPSLGTKRTHEQMENIESLIASMKELPQAKPASGAVPPLSQGNKRTRDEMEVDDGQIAAAPQQQPAAYKPPQKRGGAATKASSTATKTVPTNNQKKPSGADDPTELSWRRTMKAPDPTSSKPAGEPARKKIRTTEDPTPSWRKGAANGTQMVSIQFGSLPMVRVGSPAPSVSSLGKSPAAESTALPERIIYADPNNQPEEKRAKLAKYALIPDDDDDVMMIDSPAEKSLASLSP